MNTHIRIFGDGEALAAVAAQLLVETARRRPRAAVLLAGGTTPRRTYEVVASIATARDFAGVHLWYGDERMVPPDHADSNHAMVTRAWLAPMGLPPAQVHRIRSELTADAAAHAASQALGDGTLDLALLGIGADGHTASLFPGDLALEAITPFAAACGGARVTATLPLLSRAHQVVFLATGESKAEAVARALGEPDAATPASLVRPAGAVLWLLDRAAASELDQTRFRATLPANAGPLGGH